MPRLIEVIQAPNSRAPENINPTENAISSFAKILKYNHSAIPNRDEALAVWLRMLPVVEDADEAPHVYNLLCDEIEKNNTAVTADVALLVRIIAEAFATAVMEPTHAEGVRMVKILGALQANQQLFQACTATLTEEQQQAVAQAFQEVAAMPPPAAN